jgi:DeoR/GlpR family transcriptional regulator of sugar metabolism
VLLASGEKLGAASACRIMALADVSAVVVHKSTQASWINSARRAGVRVVKAG